jgi:hypothetical protein
MESPQLTCLNVSQIKLAHFRYIFGGWCIKHSYPKAVQCILFHVFGNSTSTEALLLMDSLNELVSDKARSNCCDCDRERGRLINENLKTKE